MEASPDSVRRALLKMKPYDLPEADRARYALLLAEATDKCELSLLPCDSLIEFAVRYYHDSDKGKAGALLYRARLQAEMGRDTLAVKSGQQALDILEDFPHERHYRLLTYGALGRWYANGKLYEKSLEALRQSLHYSRGVKDSAIAYYNMGYTYGLLKKTDSILICLQKAIKYATVANDSMRLFMAFNRYGLYLTSFSNKQDSALYYIHLSSRFIPPTIKESSKVMLYVNLGGLYYKRNQCDSAIYYFEKALPLQNLRASIVSLDYIAEIKSEQGDYKSACEYLEKETDLYDSLLYIEQNKDIARLTYQHDADKRVKKEQWRHKRMRTRIIVEGIISILLLSIYFQFRINQRKRKELTYKAECDKAQLKIDLLQKDIEGNNDIIHFLQRKATHAEEQIAKHKNDLIEQEQQIQKIYTWFFSQSPIGIKVNQLTEEKKRKVADRHVFSAQERDELYEALSGLHQDYIAELKGKNSKLSNDDLTYLCLKRMGYDAVIISLCLGYANTSALNQRKYRLKRNFNIKI